MSAIITQNFRLDATKRFVDSLTGIANESLYMGLGRPNSWSPDDNIPDFPFENKSTINKAWQEMFALKHILTTDVTYATVRHNWVSKFYTAYDDTIDISAEEYFIITPNYNVFICLKAGSGASTDSPDSAPISTSDVFVGVNDGYIWKYLYTLGIDTTNAFLTAEFIPVSKIEAEDLQGSPPASVTVQAEVQSNAALSGGAIYNIVVDNTNSNSDYSASTLAVINGDGDGNATCTVHVTDSVITAITMDTNSYGKDYTVAEVIITDPASGLGATARAVLTPPEGFGADPRNDLRAHYVLFSSKFVNSEGDVIPTTNDFRQITLVKNPVDRSTAIAAAGAAYNVCKYLKLNGATANDYPPDSIIQATDSGESGAKGFVVSCEPQVDPATNQVSHTNLYYMQNETTGYNQFSTSDTIGIDGSAVQFAVDEVVDSEIVHQSGDVLFVENRLAVSRGDNQQETIRLLIEF